jgi:nitrate reductase alpha subunit
MTPERASVNNAGTRTDLLAETGLVRAARYIQPGTPSDDQREVHRRGGRGAEEFYRERWRHDKVVRSTHGVNCTGSCSWQVYVKDGIITWETQAVDYPSVGPDSPEYEPRGVRAGRHSLGTPTRRGGSATPTCAVSY